MSQPTPKSPAGRAAGVGNFSLIARFLPILTMGLFTLTMLPNSGCGNGIFPEVTPTTTTTTVRTPTITATATTPTATASTPTSTASPPPLGKAFSMRGSGTPSTPTVGTCSGVGCGASAKHCECFQFTGTLLSTVIGSSNWSASITVNEDDCTATGTSGGICCNGDGLLSATNGTGNPPANALELSVTGPFCTDPNADDPGDFSLEANFDVVSSTSSGKFVNSTGTGQINIITNGTDAFLTTLGQIHLGKP